MEERRVERLRRTLRRISVAAVIGIAAAVAWFVFAALTQSGIQMSFAGALAAAMGTGWSAAFAAITAKVKEARATAVDA